MPDRTNSTVHDPNGVRDKVIGYNVLSHCSVVDNGLVVPDADLVACVHSVIGTLVLKPASGTFGHGCGRVGANLGVIGNGPYLIGIGLLMGIREFGASDHDETAVNHSFCTMCARDIVL